ncbi:hypothetical protein ABIB26_002329 [Arthrobacter sp. UYEF20]
MSMSPARVPVHTRATTARLPSAPAPPPDMSPAGDAAWR